VLSTASKIRIARVLYRLLRLAGVCDEQVVTRGGIRFRLDLREGIDLAVFLSGGFQRDVARVEPGAEDAVIFDVGANMGAMTLAFAKQHPQAQVHAFEPTHQALQRLAANLALNPGLAGRVTVIPTFVGRDSSTPAEPQAYSSWRVDGAPADAHAVHLGTKQAAVTSMTSLDAYAAANGITKVHLIKIDTDGHELDVLSGARNVIATSRPRIVLEMCPYLLAEKNRALTDFFDLLGPGYRWLDLAKRRPFDQKAFERLPQGGGIDVLAEAV
jgi:FkbM family methyltransferase